MFRLMNARRLLMSARGLGLASVVVVMFAFGVSSAMAVPVGEYAAFGQCPVSVAGVVSCLVGYTESGEVKMGSVQIPIVSTQTLQGGLTQNEETGALAFVGAANGETLSRTPESVPGGLSGLVSCNEIRGRGWRVRRARRVCEAIFRHGASDVNATTELAAPASSIGIDLGNLLGESGTALSLPVKVKLENPLLGNECYIGSDTNPITLNFTDGTTSPNPPNTPIKGKLGELALTAEGNILLISNNTLVDNNFSAPQATGCGGVFSSVIDPLVNAKLGLPAASGDNTAIFTGLHEQASAASVREQETVTPPPPPPPPPPSGHRKHHWDGEASSR